jgi:hypothetical protein
MQHSHAVIESGNKKPNNLNPLDSPLGSGYFSLNSRQMILIVETNPHVFAKFMYLS